VQNCSAFGSAVGRSSCLKFILPGVGFGSKQKQVCVKGVGVGGVGGTWAKTLVLKNKINSTAKIPQNKLDNLIKFLDIYF